jgi:lipoate-protein ligase A
MKSWRLVPYEIYDGALNMALDETLLENHILGATPPTVRFYGWSPAAVTVGYSQTVGSDVIERAVQSGFDVVRRPTGGRAVLHAKELTYSFIGSSDPSDPNSLSSSIIGAYKQICAALILGLEELGISTELGASDASYRQMHDCFLATTTADLHFRGKKMVGSAQCRRGKGVLQHGSILLDQDQRSMHQLLTGERSGSVDGSRQRHANLLDVLGRTVSIEELSAALKRGFERAFSCCLVNQPVTAVEREQAQAMRGKYILAQAEPVTEQRT